MADQQFCLRWNEHTGTVLKVFKQMLDDQAFVDVTLACEGKSIKAHQMILAACSTYLHDILEANTCKHPVIFLPHIKYQDIKALIDYMYCGEVYISFNHLPSLLKTAELLTIKGLTNVNSSSMSNNPDSSANSTSSLTNRLLFNSSLINNINNNNNNSNNNKSTHNQFYTPSVDTSDDRISTVDRPTSTMHQQLAIIMGNTAAAAAAAANGLQQITNGSDSCGNNNINNNNNNNLDNSTTTTSTSSYKRRKIRMPVRSRKPIMTILQGEGNSDLLNDQSISDGAGPSSSGNEMSTDENQRLDTPSLRGDSDTSAHLGNNDCVDDDCDSNNAFHNNDSLLDGDEQDWHHALSQHYGEDDEEYETHLKPEISFDGQTVDDNGTDEVNGESQG